MASRDRIKNTTWSPSGYTGKGISISPGLSKGGRISNALMIMGKWDTRGIGAGGPHSWTPPPPFSLALVNDCTPSESRTGALGLIDVANLPGVLQGITDTQRRTKKSRGHRDPWLSLLEIPHSRNTTPFTLVTLVVSFHGLTCRICQMNHPPCYEVDLARRAGHSLSMSDDEVPLMSGLFGIISCLRCYQLLPTQVNPIHTAYTSRTPLEVATLEPS